VVIGILMLMGIVTKNAIMLVDFAIEEMRGACRAPTPSSMPAASARGPSS
jgi:multidrug efflux pump subunit AcrB